VPRAAKILFDRDSDTEILLEGGLAGGARMSPDDDTEDEEEEDDGA
jgi:hypothetical protein